MNPHLPYIYSKFSPFLALRAVSYMLLKAVSLKFKFNDAVYVNIFTFLIFAVDSVIISCCTKICTEFVCICDFCKYCYKVLMTLLLPSWKIFSRLVIIDSYFVKEIQIICIMNCRSMNFRWDSNDMLHLVSDIAW